MEKKKKSPTGFIIILLIVAGVVLLVRHFHIKNFHIIKPDVLYTSGQPRGMDYTRLLYRYHIATIVNVRSAFEHREKNWHNEEITWVRNNGVKYIELPIDKSYNSPGYFPNEETQNKFLELMAEKENLPVLLHGSSGEGRVAMLTCVWLVKAEHLAAGQAIKTAGRIKGEPLVEKEIEFIHSLASER